MSAAYRNRWQARFAVPHTGDGSSRCPPSCPPPARAACEPHPPGMRAVQSRPWLPDRTPTGQRTIPGGARRSRGGTPQARDRDFWSLQIGARAAPDRRTRSGKALRGAVYSAHETRHFITRTDSEWNQWVVGLLLAMAYRLPDPPAKADADPNRGGSGPVLPWPCAPRRNAGHTLLRWTLGTTAAAAVVIALWLFGVHAVPG